MKTITKIIGSILFSSILLLSGCSSDSDTKESGILGLGSSSSSSSSVTGVSINFQELNFKPQKDNEFSLVMNLENNLLHDVDVKIRPSGFDWNYVTSGLEKEFTLQLSKATSNGPNKNAHYIEGIKLSGFTGDYNWNPIFKYCYDAQTQFREQVCVPNKLNSCDADIISDKFSNGLLSTTVEAIYPIAEDKVGIEFEVSNNNNGVVVNDCFQDENRNDFGNKISDPVVKLGTTLGTCVATSTSNGFSINQNKLTFKCEFVRSGGPSESYASQVTVDFGYKYSQSTNNQITIVDLKNRNN
jgi:opacity protein-like surface antigen